MKLSPLFFRLGLVFGCGASPLLRAAENSTPPAMAADNNKHGYTVVVDIHVDEKGQPESVALANTEDTSAGDVLTKMALAMALKTTFPPKMKDGQPVKYKARAPFFFPIEDDEGPEADALPKPKIKNAIQPAYPPELRKAGVVGGAVLEVFVDATGKLTQIKTLRASHPEFEKAARESVEKWDFSAAQKDGQPVASRSRVAIVFDTQESMADLKWRIAPRPKLGSFTVIRPDHPITDEEAGVPPAPGANASSEQAPAATPPPTVPPAPGK